MDHYGEEKNPFFVFRQWVENIATQKQVQPIMYGKKFASDNYQKSICTYLSISGHCAILGDKWIRS